MGTWVWHPDNSWHMLNAFLVSASFALQEGESFVTEDCSERCTCLGNSSLDCIALSCSPDEACKVQSGLKGCYPASIATCHVYGDPHYSTFDRRLHHFQGACNYTLAETCNSSIAAFSITARNEHRSSPSWTALNSVALTLDGLHIALRKGRVVFVSVCACIERAFPVLLSHCRLRGCCSSPGLSLHQTRGGVNGCRSFIVPRGQCDTKGGGGVVFKRTLKFKLAAAQVSFGAGNKWISALNNNNLNNGKV